MVERRRRAFSIPLSPSSSSVRPRYLCVTFQLACPSQSESLWMSFGSICSHHKLAHSRLMSWKCKLIALRSAASCAAVRPRPTSSSRIARSSWSAGELSFCRGGGIVDAIRVAPPLRSSARSRFTLSSSRSVSSGSSSLRSASGGATTSQAAAARLHAKAGVVRENDAAPAPRRLEFHHGGN